MATTRIYNWKDINGSPNNTKLDNVAKSYTDRRALHIIQLLSSIHKSWEPIDQTREMMGISLDGLTHRSLTQMLSLEKFIKMCDFDGIELDTINVEKLRKLLFKPPADGTVVPGPNSQGLVGWYFPPSGPVQLCEVVNPYSDRTQEIREAQDLLNPQNRGHVGAGVHVLRFQLKRWCESNRNFEEVLQLKAAIAQLEQKIFTFLTVTLKLPKTGLGKTFRKLGEYLVKNAADQYSSSKRDTITEQEIAEWTGLKDAYVKLTADSDRMKLELDIRFPRIIKWAMENDWTLNGRQLTDRNMRVNGILHLLNEVGCIMNADLMNAIIGYGPKNNVSLSDQLNDFVGETVGDRYNRVKQLTMGANDWLKTNGGHGVLEAKGSDRICTNKLILQVLTRWKQGRIGFTNIGEEIKLCFQDYERFFLLPDPNFKSKLKRSFNSYHDAKSYVIYGVTRLPPSPEDHPSLDCTYNLAPNNKVKWRDYFQRAIRRPYKQYGESPAHQENVRTARNGTVNLSLGPGAPDPTNANFSNLDRNPTPAIKALQQAGVSNAGQCCAVCSKIIRNGSNTKWSKYLGGGRKGISQSFDVDHIANLIYNELFKLNTGGYGFLNTCTGCNQHFKSEKIWCPSYNLWYYLLNHAYTELLTMNQSLDKNTHRILTAQQFYDCYPWPGWNKNGIPGVSDIDGGYNANTKISEFNMYCTINSYGSTSLPGSVTSAGLAPPTKNGNASKQKMWKEGQGMGSTKNNGTTVGMGSINIATGAGKITALKLETIILDRFANIIRMKDDDADYEGIDFVDNILKVERDRLIDAMRIGKDNTVIGCNPKEIRGGQIIANKYFELIRQFPVVSKFESMIQIMQTLINAGRMSADMHVLGKEWVEEFNRRDGVNSSSGTAGSVTAQFLEESRQRQIQEAREALQLGEAMILSFSQEQGAWDTFDRLDIARIFPQSTVDRNMMKFFESQVTYWIRQRADRLNEIDLIHWSRDVVRLIKSKDPSQQQYQQYRDMSAKGIKELSRAFEEKDRYNRLSCVDLNHLMTECHKKLEETQALAERFHIGISESEAQLKRLTLDNQEATDLSHRIKAMRRAFGDIISHLQYNTVRFGILYQIFVDRSISILQCGAQVQLQLPAQGKDIGDSDYYQSQDPQSSPPGSPGKNEKVGARTTDLATVDEGNTSSNNDDDEDDSNSSNNSLDVSDKSDTGEDYLITPERPQGAAAVATPGSGNLGGDEQGSPESEGPNTDSNQGIRRRTAIPFQLSNSSLGSAPRRSAFNVVSGVDESGSGNNQRPPSRKRERQGEGGEARPPSRLRGPYDGIGVFITSLFGPTTFFRRQWVDWDQVDNAITLLIRNNPEGHPNLSRVWQEQDSEFRREWFIGYLNHIGARTPGHERQVRINRNGSRFQFLEPRGFGGGGRKRTRKKRRKKKKTKRKRKYRKKTKGRKRRRKKRTRRK